MCCPLFLSQIKSVHCLADPRFALHFTGNLSHVLYEFCQAETCEMLGFGGWVVCLICVVLASTSQVHIAVTESSPYISTIEKNEEEEERVAAKRTDHGPTTPGN